MKSTSRVRLARRTHICSSCCERVKAGDLYLEGTVFPGHDTGFADTAGHPIRLAECRSCVEQYGRGDMFPKGMDRRAEVAE